MSLTSRTVARGRWRTRALGSRRNLCSRRPAIVSVGNADVTVGEPPRVLVAGLGLTIRESERWAVVGPNGCGKSVTTQHLGRLLKDCQPSNVAAFISFESHRQLLRDELRQFNESRFSVCHKRATVASYLFPELHPPDPEYPDGYVGYRPPATRLSPIPVPYDAGSEHPALAELELAASGGRAEWLLRQLGLFDLRHQPVHGLSTGEGRKLMLVHCLLAPSRLLVLDEAFDGLDSASRRRLSDVLQDVLGTTPWRQSALAMVTHRKEDYEGISPTHALLLGQGTDGTEYRAGEWTAMEPAIDAHFEAQRAGEVVSMRPHLSQTGARKPFATEASRVVGGMPVRGEGSQEPLVELRDVSIRYPTSVVFNPPLSWTVREGEKWAVSGGNGSGKSTLLEIISGENVKAYQEDVRLFGRKKGAGVSVWEIKRQLGVLSTEFHMAYVDYADPSIRTFAHKPSVVSTWEVVCSGFFDSIGLYSEVGRHEVEVVQEWLDFFGLQDLVKAPEAAGPRSRRAASGAACPDFAALSQGQQRLVLLCRAMVKRPRLLLLDEPTHGLSGYYRERLLDCLRGLAERPDVAIIYVTHRADEVESLALPNVLHLPDRTQLGSFHGQGGPIPVTTCERLNGGIETL